jgi:hypothetical protein
MGGGSVFWKTKEIGLPSYSNNVSTGITVQHPRGGMKHGMNNILQTA